MLSLILLKKDKNVHFIELSVVFNGIEIENVKYYGKKAVVGMAYFHGKSNCNQN